MRLTSFIVLLTFWAQGAGAQSTSDITITGDASAESSFSSFIVYGDNSVKLMSCDLDKDTPKNCKIVEGHTLEEVMGVILHSWQNRPAPAAQTPAKPDNTFIGTDGKVWTCLWKMEDCKRDQAILNPPAAQTQPESGGGGNGDAYRTDSVLIHAPAPSLSCAPDCRFEIKTKKVGDPKVNAPCLDRDNVLASIGYYKWSGRSRSGAKIVPPDWPPRDWSMSEIELPTCRITYLRVTRELWLGGERLGTLSEGPQPKP